MDERHVNGSIHLDTSFSKYDEEISAVLSSATESANDTVTTFSSSLDSRLSTTIESRRKKRKDKKIRKKNKYSIDIQIKTKEKKENNGLTLSELKGIFKDADTDGKGYLEEREFIVLFENLLEDCDESDLRLLFRKIDTNTIGYITFEQFQSYFILKENENTNLVDKEINTYKRNKLPRHLLPKDIRKQFITSMEVDKEKGIYYTANKEGTVCSWNANDLMHLKTIQYSPRKLAVQDMFFDSFDRELYVAYLDHVIHVYDEDQNLKTVYTGSFTKNYRTPNEEIGLNLSNYSRNSRYNNGKY